MPDQPQPPDDDAKPASLTFGAAGLATGQSPAVNRRFRSEQLFGDHTEVEIQHGASVYRLRLTSLGKLILTK